MFDLSVRAMVATALTSILLGGGTLAVESTTTPAAAADPQSAPSEVSARAGVNQAKVYWQPPADGSGAAVTAYTVTSSPEGKSCTGATGARSCYVTGLTNGQAYTFSVTATSAAGVSDAVTTNLVTPATDTTKPTLVSSEVTPDRASSIGGTTITVRLRITDDLSGRAAPSGALDANPAILFDHATSSATFGFTRSVNRISGDEYDGIYQASVTVPAGTAAGTWNLTVYPIRDAAGNSSSFISRPGVLIGAPAAPTAVEAAVGAGRQVSVSWQAPADNGGNVITSYRLTDSYAGITRTVDGTTWTGAFADIPDTTALTFTVVAVNVAGASVPSAPSAAITVPAQAPSVVRSLTAARGDQSAVLDWDAPANPNGAPVTGYTVTTSPGEHQITTDAETTQATISGLTNGDSYSFTIVATNSAGDSEPVQAGPVAPAGVPTGVTDVAATAGDRGATVSWSLSDGNGTPVTGYTVTAAPGGQQTTVGSDATQAQIAGLTNGVAYTFTVTATNSVGSSPASSPSAAVVPVGAPLAVPGVRVVRGDRSLAVAWSAAPANGTPITGYRITYNGAHVDLPPSARSTRLSGLSNGVTYRIRVTALNAAGVGTPSATVNGIPAGRPGRVAKPAATVSGRTVRLTWRAPANNGAPITAYVITGGMPRAKTVSGSVRNFVFRNLARGSYVFRVAAKNAVGAGSASVGVTVRVR